jgi:hypothetical protein
MRGEETRSDLSRVKVIETASEILAAPFPDASPKEVGMPSLLHGFEAVMPT